MNVPHIREHTIKNVIPAFCGGGGLEEVEVWGCWDEKIITKSSWADVHMSPCWNHEGGINGQHTVHCVANNYCSNKVTYLLPYWSNLDWFSRTCIWYLNMRVHTRQYIDYNDNGYLLLVEGTHLWMPWFAVPSMQKSEELSLYRHKTWTLDCELEHAWTDWTLDSLFDSVNTIINALGMTCLSALSQLHRWLCNSLIVSTTIIHITWAINILNHTA